MRIRVALAAGVGLVFGGALHRVVALGRFMAELFAAWRAAMPCRESADGQHVWTHETDRDVWRLRCVECRARTRGIVTGRVA